MRLLLILFFMLIITGCKSSDLQRLEAFSGVKLPYDIKVLSKEDNWISPNGEGYSLRIYRFSESIQWIDEKQCDKNGFNVSRPVDMKVRLPVLEKYVNTDLPVCYKVESNLMQEQVIFIQDSTVIYYWAAS